MGEILAYLPPAKVAEISKEEEFPENPVDPNVIYYARYGEGDDVVVKIYICPHLNEEGEIPKCGNYPNRPEWCKRFKRGGRECNKKRKRAGLPKVPKAFEEK